MSRRTVVSSPGKVLITGGYLVLERPFAGLVLPTEARFFCGVESLPRAAGAGDSSPKTQFALKVASPQFGLFTELVATLGEDGAVCVSAVAHSTEAFEKFLGDGLSITIVADNDFYSQTAELERRNLSVSLAALRSLPRFCAPGVSLENVAKTGLGSSAALITSLSAAILAHFEVISLRDYDGESHNRHRKLAHNVAQLAHCAAQGKIGSGFDISAAVWGGHRYVRFAPEVLEPVMASKSIHVPTLLETVSPESAAWNSVTEKFSLPPCFHLCLGDVSSGSSTPKMVSKILEWKKMRGDEASLLWNELASWNDTVDHLLRKISDFAAIDPDYASNLEKIAAHKLEECPVDGDLIRLHKETRQAFSNVRRCLREMGERATVPVEPPTQTSLLNECENIPGVLFAGVPGAGGYDAVFCIIFSEAARLSLEQLWVRWQGDAKVCPLLSDCGASGVQQHADDFPLPSLQL